MKMYLMKCPNCGGQLEVDAGMESFYCKYCGTKIVVDKTELEIRRMEHEEKLKEHEERMKDKEIKSEKISAFSETVYYIMIGVLMAIMLAGAVIMKLTK